jgi:hypothetical protein
VTAFFQSEKAPATDKGRSIFVWNPGFAGRRVAYDGGEPVIGSRRVPVRSD